MFFLVKLIFLYFLDWGDIGLFVRFVAEFFSKGKLLNDVFYDLWPLNFLFGFFIIWAGILALFRAHHFLPPHFLVLFYQKCNSLVVSAILCQFLVLLRFQSNVSVVNQKLLYYL